MFSQYEPNVKATIIFLHLLKVKVNNTTVNETLQNHPDWPSLLCIEDSLNRWGLPSGAGRVDADQIDQLPLPFIANVKSEKSSQVLITELVIVSKLLDNQVQLYCDDYNKLITKSKDDFLSLWDGVYLIAEPNARSGERDYETNKRKALFNSLVPASLLTLLGVLIFSILYTQNVSAAIYLQDFVMLTGATITSLLLWYEMDESNPLLQKVCTGITKGNCNAILTSKQAKLFSWLSWSEVGFFYFTGSLLVTLFVPDAIGLLAWLNVLALPYTFFSVYYQWRVVGQWCILCLCVQALLVFGAANMMIGHFLFPFTIPTAAVSVKMIIMYILPVLVWYTIKPFTRRLQEAKNTKRQYLRIKFNIEIFEILLKKQRAVDVPPDGLGIDLGNPEARNTLIKVCNPYCGPCAKAHPEIERLMDETPDLKVKIIFTTPNQPTHPSFKITKHLMAIASKQDKAFTKQALDDWYTTNKKDYIEFAAKYPINGELQIQDGKIEAMYKWSKDVDIQFTPSIFINGNQLPDGYNIGDLQYFLLE